MRWKRQLPSPTAALLTQTGCVGGSEGVGPGLTNPPGDSDASPSLRITALECKLHEDRIFDGLITAKSPVLEQCLAYYRHSIRLWAVNKYF